MSGGDIAKDRSSCYWDIGCVLDCFRQAKSMGIWVMKNKLLKRYFCVKVLVVGGQRFVRKTLVRKLVGLKAGVVSLARTGSMLTLGQLQNYR